MPIMLLAKPASLPAPSMLLAATPPFTCALLTGKVCDPFTCELCNETICAEDEHWMGDPDWCTQSGISVLVHRHCHDRTSCSNTCRLEETNR